MNDESSSSSVFPPWGFTPSRIARSREEFHKFIVRLDTLDQDQRLAVLAHRVLELSHEEIAKIMGRSVRAVEGLSSRGRAKLRRLEADDDDRP